MCGGICIGGGIAAAVARFGPTLARAIAGGGAAAVAVDQAQEAASDDDDWVSPADDLTFDPYAEVDEFGQCPAEAETGDDCDKLNAIDTSTCNAISRIRGARAGAVCHQSASERFAACLAGRSIPPLNTWAS